MEIINMNRLNHKQLTQAAQMLTDELAFGWKTFEEAMDEIEAQNTMLAAVEKEEVWGWFP